MSYEDFAARLIEIEAEANEARLLIEEAVLHDRQRRRLEQERERLGSVLGAIPDYFERAPRAEVNLALRELFEAVYVDTSGKIIRLELN